MKLDKFLEYWQKSTRTEKSAAHEHFLGLCEILEVEKPGDVDPEGTFYTFEKHVTKADGTSGYVDVWRKNCFAWEYKRSYEGEFNHKNLVKAQAQVKQYADALENPPLLIVSDMKEIRVHTNFTNTVSEQHVFKLPDINDSKVRRTLKWCFTDPEKLRPEITVEGVTAKAAMALGVIAAKLGKNYDPRRVAHFLNKLVFCLFAEDIDLLPDDIFADILEEGLKDADRFPVMLGDLFRAMKDKNGRFGLLGIPWFNGGLFDDDDVLPLGFYEIRDLADAARLDWSVIEPAIFGTLFEGGLNPDKRKQMASLFDAYGVEEESASSLPGILAAPQADKGVGIHYTDPDTIMKIVEPVVIRPLRREWKEVKASIAKKRKTKDKAKSDAARTRAENEIRKLFFSFRKRLGDFRVLDPACGSGNFLYLSLQHLKDFELQVLKEAEKLGLPLEDPQVGPDAVLGIEINPYAAELARVTIWIGELQWQRNNAFGINRAPILGDLDGIVNKDALVNADGSVATWPEANVVVGNPPFLGNKRMIASLGEVYTERLRGLYEGRVPGGADLVTYWFEKSRALIEKHKLERAGLVATNSIRGGTNRKVLKRICDTGAISDAWSDEPWVLNGAAVRVSLVGFGPKDERLLPILDGQVVEAVFPDLTGPIAATNGVNLTETNKLTQNSKMSFQGPVLVGPFDIPRTKAIEWLSLPLNPNGKSNSDVLRPLTNGKDIVSRPREMWVIDFFRLPAVVASLYEAPFEYVRAVVKPVRDKNTEKWRKENWWLHGRTGDEFRKAVASIKRYIATSQVSKHRIFVWMATVVQPHQTVIAVARDDDVTFGILHSRFHGLWALRLGTSLEDRPRYTPSTTFETFPFPEGLTLDIPAKDYAGDPRAQAIAEAAIKLNELRENWLNPPDLVRREPEVVEGYPDRILPAGSKAEKELKKRTLTNLYNKRPAWLDNAHKALDRDVAAAYGWSDDLSDDEVLERLFKLNQERAAAQKGGVNH